MNYIWLVTLCIGFISGIILGNKMSKKKTTSRSPSGTSPLSGTFVKLKTPPPADLGSSLSEKRATAQTILKEQLENADDESLLKIYDSLRQ